MRTAMSKNNHLYGSFKKTEPLSVWSVSSTSVGVVSVVVEVVVVVVPEPLEEELLEEDPEEELEDPVWVLSKWVSVPP